jgi:hypothetical protein
MRLRGLGATCVINDIAIIGVLWHHISEWLCHKRYVGMAKTRKFTPAPEALAGAKKKRMIALGLWFVAIALEIVAIV